MNCEIPQNIQKSIKNKVIGAQFGAQKGVPSDDIMKPVRIVNWTKNPAQFFQFKLFLNLKVLTQSLV